MTSYKNYEVMFLLSAFYKQTWLSASYSCCQTQAIFQTVLHKQHQYVNCKSVCNLAKLATSTQEMLIRNLIPTQVEDSLKVYLAWRMVIAERAFSTCFPAEQTMLVLCSFCWHNCEIEHFGFWRARAWWKLLTRFTGCAYKMVRVNNDKTQAVGNLNS